MNLQNIDHHFCEGKITGTTPELLNSYSSLFISLYSLYGIFVNKINIEYCFEIDGYIELSNQKLIYINLNNNFIIHLIYYIICITGIGSFGYHWTEQVGWAFMDEMPMILSLFIGILYIENTLYILKKPIVYNILLVAHEVIYKLKQLVLYNTIQICRSLSAYYG